MTIDEKFFAWLDGELDARESADVEAEVAADPRLSDLAARHRALRTHLKTTFDTVHDAPLPADLAATAREHLTSADVLDLNAKSRPNSAWRAWNMLPLGALMAATLAIGIVVGTMVPHRSGGPVEARGDQLYAAAALDKALDTQLASAPGTDIRIDLTFRNRAGEICRGFTSRSSSGLACRKGRHWAVKALLPAQEGQSNDYRMASGRDSNLGALVDSMMVGEPFDAAKERTARERGWR